METQQNTRIRFAGGAAGQTEYAIPACPRTPSVSEAAAQVLAVAESYLRQADRLIYSYGSKTFLAGYPLFDPDFGDRGNIDCSTFVSLVLAGIPYEDSPYAAGTVKGLRPGTAAWTEKTLTDFANLPDHFTGIAERIGRPYLAGPKGLDLEKAAALGIRPETLGEEIRKSGVGRRSVYIAEYYLKQGRCFTDYACAECGDIVFFRSSGFFREGGKTFRAEAEITHVGIIADNPAQMIHCSGFFDKSRAVREHVPAISLAPVRGNRIPAFFARPGYGVR